MTLYKLVVLGGDGVGKTALTIQFCLNHFVETYDPTIEDSYRKQSQIDGQSCTLEVLDTAGQDEYTALRDQWIRVGEGFLLVYSVSSRSSFSRVQELHKQIRRIKKSSQFISPDSHGSPLSAASLLHGNADLPPIMLVGNKCDRVTEREVLIQEGKALAEELGCQFLETSAKECINVEKAFHDVVRRLRRERHSYKRQDNQLSSSKDQLSRPQNQLSRSRNRQSRFGYSRAKNIWPDIESSATFFESVSRLWRPHIPAGYRRLEWRCTCGELLYGDFREASRRSLDQLRSQLRVHSKPTPSQHSGKQGTSLPESSKRRSKPGDAGPGWMPPGSRSQDDSDDTTTVDPLSTHRPRTPPPNREALQLCVETGKYSTELGDFPILKSQSDGALFEQLRESYNLIRQSHIPMRFRFRKPNQAIYVKFRVGKPPFVSISEGTCDTPSIPPSAEVTAQRYKYDPCPIDMPPMDSRTFMHYFYLPASSHPEIMWGPRLPRKLGSSLGPQAQGWGIQLVERPDWSLFSALMGVLVLLSGAVGGIYAWRTNDHATGVAIGTWLTAVQALLVTATFFWWT